MDNKNLTIIILAVLCLVLAAGLLYSNLGSGFGKIVVKPEKAKELVLSYINEQILQGLMEAEVEGEVEEEAGLYKMNIKIGEENLFVFATKDGKLLFPQAIELTVPTTTSNQQETLAGSFSESQEEVCLEDGKPIVYFFGSESCSHCAWEHPIIEKVAEDFKDYISFHNNMGNEADMDIFNLFSSGGVPTLVLGCRYYRVGSGELWGEEEEIEALNSLICQLTNNQPQEICSE